MGSSPLRPSSRLLWAPTINSYKRFQPGSWAPTAIGWGLDNRTLGFRKVGHGKGTRVECRIPGSDANSYFAFAGTLAGGLHGIVNRIEPPAAVHRQRLRRTPTCLDPVEHRRSDRSVGGLGRRQAGVRPDVHHHILNMAKQEWAAFNRSVTDWELRRYWERI